MTHAAIDDVVLRKLWATRVHAADIATQLGCSRDAVFRRARALGLPHRGRGKALARQPHAAKTALGAAATASIEAPSGGGTDTAGGAVPRGLTLEQAVALDGGTWAGRARIAARFGVPARQVEQVWHRHRADPKARRAG